MRSKAYRSKEPEIDTLHSQIHQLIVEQIPEALDAFLDLAKDRRELVKRIGGKIRAVDVKKLDGGAVANLTITGTDGGGDSKELEGSFFGIVSAIAYTSRGPQEEDKTPIASSDLLIWDEEFEAGKRAAVIRDRIMYQVAKRAVEGRRPDLLLIDGPLIPNFRYLPDTYDSVDYKKDFRAMMDALTALLNLSQKEFDERGMLIAGVVKRVRSTRYSKILELEKEIRDSALLNPILAPGQRTEPIDAPPSRMLNLFPEAHRAVKQFFLKASRFSPIRVEIPGWLADKIGDIASAIYSTADPLTGVPFHILRADILTRINIPVTDLTYNRFISRVMDKVKAGEMSESDLDLARLRRLEPWRL